jgi:hypothetical protein
MDKLVIFHTVYEPCMSLWIVLNSVLTDADSALNRSQTVCRRKGIEFLHACLDPYLLSNLTSVLQEIGTGWNTYKNPASCDRGEVNT